MMAPRLILEVVSLTLLQNWLLFPAIVMNVTVSFGFNVYNRRWEKTTNRIPKNHSKFWRWSVAHKLLHTPLLFRKISIYLSLLPYFSKLTRCRVGRKRCYLTRNPVLPKPTVPNS